MDTFPLRVKIRSDVGRNKVRAHRQTGQIPAVLYGHKVATRNLLAPRNEFLKVYRQSIGSQLVDLIVDDAAPVKAIVQEVQRDPVTSDLLHIDFHQVNLKEKITATIRLRFTGVAPAVKESGGVLMTNLEALPVSCLPQDLVPEITVDIAQLKKFDDYVHVKDLALPPGVSTLARPDDVVAHVIPPRSEEEIKALEQQPAAAAAAEVPVAGKEEKGHAQSPAEQDSPAAKRKA